MPAKKEASPREQYLHTWQVEYPTTLKVLRAFPAEKADWKPHEKSRSAKQLAATMAGEERAAILGILAGKMDFSQMPDEKAMSYDELLAWYEASHAEMVAKYNAASDDELYGTIPFFEGPGKMVDMPKMGVLWMILLDSIHHRGQFSVYLRMVGAKVPSIYGPTADEPWPM